ncbi:MAG: TrbC/VirB2 family protein [Rickettsiales bacterium]
MKNNYFSWCLALAAAALILTPDMAHALASPTALSETLCGVVGWFTGPVGAGIATLAIIVIGVGALLGKVSWGMAIIVGLGVAIIFGAPTIVKALSGSASTCT